jgi:hypothetical protein
MEEAGFTDVSTVDRNGWYREVARGELERLKGPIFERAANAVGEDYVDKNIRTWEAMQKVLDSASTGPPICAQPSPEPDRWQSPTHHEKPPPEAAEADRKGRKASKEVRRQQLIEATIDSLAKRGYSETTMADVADGAGLSRGIVNFHFEARKSCSSRRCNTCRTNIPPTGGRARRRATTRGAAVGAGRGRFRPRVCKTQARRLVRLLGRGQVAADLSGAVRRTRRPPTRTP